MPLCTALTAEYDTLLAKKREFDAMLLQAETDPTLLDQLLTLKAELTEGKRVLEDKLFVSLETAEQILGKENVLSDRTARA